MSGPLRADEAVEDDPDAHRRVGAVEVTPARSTEVGGVPVRRALPRRALRTVGAWCFADHFGPVDAERSDAMQVGPHPHTGLHTVTWLLEGEVLHTDSVGSEQLIRPGQLNLMTAGRGVSHAESARRAGGLQGAQLWVAQPDATRDGPPGFAHHAELPTVAVGDAVATVIIGSLAGSTSPAEVDTDLLGVEVAMSSGRADVPLDAAHEHAVVVLTGALEVAGTTVEPGHLAHLGTGRAEVRLAAVGVPTRALLLGGAPLGEELLMWWNLVARTRDEIDEARAAWEAGDARFSPVATDLDRIAAPPTPWSGG